MISVKMGICSSIGREVCRERKGSYSAQVDALKEGADNRTYGERLRDVERLEVRGA